MKVNNCILGAWFNQRRFNQRKAKGYALSKRFDHRLSRWFNYLLFRLLPSEWYLRMWGVRLAPPVKAAVTYYLHDQIRVTQLKYSAGMIMDAIPIWFKHGFYEPIGTGGNGKRYYIPPGDLVEVRWYDPILEDDISIDGPYWRLA